MYMQCNVYVYNIQSCGKSSLVSELAVTYGRLLFAVNCSPLTDGPAVLEAVKGMSSTGMIVHARWLSASTTIKCAYYNYTVKVCSYVHTKHSTCTINLAAFIMYQI